MEDTLRILDFVRPGGLIIGLLVLATTWLVVRFVVGSLEGLGRRFTGRRLTLHQAATISRLGIYVVGVTFAVLLTFQLSRETLLAVGGTVAVAMGFAFKDLAGSVLAGLLIVVDRPFQVGDRVSFAGFYGEVTQIGLRTVRMVTLDDNQVTIPNNKFLTEAVACGNGGALDMLIQMDFYVGLDQDLDQAKQIVRDALTSSRYTYIGKPWTIVVNEVIHESYFAIRLRAKAYVLDVQYEKAFETDVTERVRRGFRQLSVLPPAILHRDVGSVPSRDERVRAA